MNSNVNISPVSTELPTIKKILRPKKWSQVYVDKIENDRIEREKVVNIKQQNIQMQWAVMLLSRKFTGKLRRVIHRTRERREEQLNAVPTFSKWESHWGTQAFCKLCMKPAFSDCVGCKTCNSIAHTYCLPVDDTTDLQKYKCTECVALYREEKRRHSIFVSRRKNEKLLMEKGYFLARKISSYVLRRRFLILRKSAIKVQACIRKFIHRSKFNAWRRAQIRAIIVEIRDLPEVFVGSTVILTVLDTMKYTQIFRYDRVCDKHNFKHPVTYLLPGITKNTILVLTVAYKDETGQLQCWRLQSQFTPNDILQTLKSVTRPMKFSNTIQYTPHNATHSNQDSRKTGNVADTKKPLIADITEETCQIRIKVLNPILSPCLQVHGPPLDVLRRPGDHYFNPSTKKGKERVSDRRSKWWICIVDAKLCFYQFFGDSYPRYVVLVKDASVFISKAFPNNAVIQFADKRKWQLECRSELDAKKFANAVREWKKVYENSSIIHSAADSAREPPFHILLS